MPASAQVEADAACAVASGIRSAVIVFLAHHCHARGRGVLGALQASHAIGYAHPGPGGHSQGSAPIRKTQNWDPRRWLASSELPNGRKVGGSTVHLSKRHREDLKDL